LTLFNQDSQVQTQDTVDEQTDYLAQLVGDDKKFKDIPSLARGKAEADAFIARLQREQQELREELARRDRMGELIDRLENQNKPNQEQRQQDTPNGTDTDRQLDPAKLNEIVEDLITQREKRNSASQNITAVKKTLAEKLGPQYSEKLKQKASELGVSTDWMNSVAEQSPTAFYNLIGLNQSAPQRQDVFTPPQGQGRSSFEPSNVERNNTFYENIKKADPKKYWSPATQNQLHKDAIRLGEKFFS